MEQKAIICSVFLLLLLVLVQRVLVLYNLSTVAIDNICLSLRVMVKSYEACGELPDVYGLFRGLMLLVTHLIQCKYGSTEVYRKSLVRSQVQIMQNEKTDTFESLYPAVHRSKLLKIHDNLTTKQTKFK